MSAAVSYWTNTLTDAQRQAWSTYAAATPTVNRLGNQLILSGQQMFLRTSCARNIAGLAQIYDAPTEAGLGPLPEWNADPNVDPDIIQGQITIPGVGTDGDVNIYASAPVMPSQTVSHASRRFAFVEGPPVASVFTVNGASPYPYTVGQKVRVFAVYLDDTGRVSAEAFRDTIVVPV